VVTRHWWEEAVFYQIYPRSFADSNGDGIGDLPGIESRLDYLSTLGVDALWISPFFPSPMKDFGYDISDYRGVDPIFGCMGDFERLLASAKARGLRIVLDLVANHSSDEHPWFAEARSSRETPKHGWYLWAEDEGRPPNNWKALFELGSAWFPNPATRERYLATFSRHQPEFDWRNPELREAIYDAMRFWFGLGVDGFRLDVATAYFKDEELRSNPFSFKAIPDFFQKHIYDRNRDEVHEVFREMRNVADGAGEKVLIGETHGQDPALAASCHGAVGDELHMAFNFDFLARPWNAEAFRGSAQRWYALLPAEAWPNFTLSNHDVPRHYWRYGGRGLASRGSGGEARADSRARVAAAMLLTLRGTPFLYYGEEIGLSCVRIPRSALRDPVGIRTWPIGFLGRDPERTPMQWDDSEGAGFTSGEPWLPINPDWRRKNVAAQSIDPGSLLSWYKGLLSLRRERRALREGDLAFLECASGILAYERIAEAERIGVFLNFRNRALPVDLRAPVRVLLGTARERGTRVEAGSGSLAPGEVLIGAYEP
jgi:alpha-glucosidase